MTAAKRVRLLVEGWRGISHSFALVNQYQLLELRKYRGIALFQRDLPYVDAAWNARRNDAGFDEEKAAALAAIPPPGAIEPTCVFRISFPHRMYGADAARVTAFATSENHRLAGHFYEGPETARKYANDFVRVVTPSQWSKTGLVRHGIDPQRIDVIPHGIDPEVFYPPEVEESRQVRASLDIADDAVVFLNVSAMTFNKGIDKLLTAFCLLKRKHPHIVLLLKDQSLLYGLTARDILRALAAERPDIADAEAFAGIRLISDNFSLGQMRLLYGCADAYVSCYRAEGFNMPPLEAAACGVPVLVTAGGSTDDYFHPSFAAKIASTPASSDRHGTYLEPDLDSLVAAMEQVIEGRLAGRDAAAGVSWIGEHFSWAAVTRQLVGVLTGVEAAELA